MLQDPAFAKKVLSDKVRSTVSKVAALENTSEKLVKAIQSSEQWSWLKGSKMEEKGYVKKTCPGIKPLCYR